MAKVGLSCTFAWSNGFSPIIYVYFEYARGHSTPHMRSNMRVSLALRNMSS